MRHLLVILAAAAAMAAPAAAQPAAQAGHIYTVIYSPGPKWAVGKPNAEQGLGPHARYYADLTKKGVVVAAGGFPVTNGGMAIFRAPSDEAAQAIVQQDPAVSAGIFIGDLRRWSPRFDNTGQLAAKP